MERVVGECAADSLQHIQVPTGPRLELHPLEARLQRLLDVAQEHVEGVLDSEVRPCLHHVAGAAEHPVQRLPLYLRLQRPPRQLDSRLGEGVPLEHGEPLVQVIRGIQLLAHQRGAEHLFEQEEGRARRLRRIGGSKEGRRLAPSFVVAADRLDQDRVYLPVLAVRRPPRVLEGHCDVVEFDGVYTHQALLDARVERLVAQTRD